jgi:hypothetical protein
MYSEFGIFGCTRLFLFAYIFSVFIDFSKKINQNCTRVSLWADIDRLEI